MHFLMCGGKWKPLKGRIRVLGINKADRPEFFLRLRHMLYTLVEGRLPDVDDWTKYILGALDGGAGRSDQAHVGGMLRHIENDSSDDI